MWDNLRSRELLVREIAGVRFVLRNDGRIPLVRVESPVRSSKGLVRIAELACAVESLLDCLGVLRLRGDCGA